MGGNPRFYWEFAIFWGVNEAGNDYTIFMNIWQESSGPLNPLIH
jgi:hypothetical protein